MQKVIFLFLLSMLTNAGSNNSLNFIKDLALEGDKSCKGMDLVNSCGNGICDSNETIANCKADCLQGAYKSYNLQTTCHGVKKLFKPTNSLEVQDALKYALDYGFRVRAVGQLHSANSILCNSGVVISTEKLNKIHKLEMYQGEETVLVDAGVKLKDLGAWLHERKRSVGYTLIGFDSVSVAGSTATGSHGSSAKHPTVLASLIRSMTVVGADGELIEYNHKNTTGEQWKALRTSLGLLGVITQMRLKVFPQFKLHTKVTFGSDSKLVKKDWMLNKIKACDWGQIQWFPGVGQYLMSCGNETDKDAHKDAQNTLLWPDIPESIIGPFKKVIQYGACSKKANCAIEAFRFSQYLIQPPFKRRNALGKMMNVHNLVGYSHKMTTSSFAPFAHGFSQMDWELAVPEESIEGAIKELREYFKNENICMPFIGVFIRFTKVEDTTLLAHSSAGGKFKKGEIAMYIELPAYIPVGFNQDERMEYDKKYEKFAKILIEKYGARAHWGKNRDWFFNYQNKFNAYGDKISRFQKVVNKLDPIGVFANSWANNFGIKWLTMPGTFYKDQCLPVHRPVCNTYGKKYKNTCYALMDKQDISDLSLKFCKK